jgi:hypothetical protein
VTLVVVAFDVVVEVPELGPIHIGRYAWLSVPKFADTAVSLSLPTQVSKAFN